MQKQLKLSETVTFVHRYSEIHSYQRFLFSEELVLEYILTLITYLIEIMNFIEKEAKVYNNLLAYLLKYLKETISFANFDILHM